MARM